MIQTFFRLNHTKVLFILVAILFAGCSNTATQEKDILSPELQEESMNEDLSTINQEEHNDESYSVIDQEESNNENLSIINKESLDIQPYTFTYKEQEFEIIPLYAEFLAYITRAREAKIDDWVAIYKEEVEDAFQRSAWGYVKSSVPVNPNNDVFTPSYRLDQLEESVLTLIEQHDHLNTLIAEALQKSAELLPKEHRTKVYVLPSIPEIYEGMKFAKGVGGITYDTQIVVVQIEPKTLAEEILQFLVAHEYHHLVYHVFSFQKYRPYTFLESIVIEGKAEAFASLVYPEIIPPGLKPLPNERHVWETMKRAMDPESTFSINFTYGNRALNIPPMSDYNIGYQIMQDFIKNNPDVSIEEWTDMRADEILELSQFEKRFTE